MNATIIHDEILTTQEIVEHVPSSVLAIDDGISQLFLDHATAIKYVDFEPIGSENEIERDVKIVSTPQNRYLYFAGSNVLIDEDIDIDGSGSSALGTTNFSISLSNGKAASASATSSSASVGSSVPRYSEYVGGGGAAYAVAAGTVPVYSAGSSGNAAGGSAAAKAYVTSGSTYYYAAIATGGSMIILQADSVEGSGSISANGGYATRQYNTSYYATAAGGGGAITIFTKKWSGTVGLSADAGSANAEEGSIRLWRINDDGTLTLMANRENGVDGVTLTINSIEYVPQNGGDFSIAF